MSVTQAETIATSSSSQSGPNNDITDSSKELFEQKLIELYLREPPEPLQGLPKYLLRQFLSPNAESVATLQAMGGKIETTDSTKFDSCNTNILDQDDSESDNNYVIAQQQLLNEKNITQQQFQNSVSFPFTDLAGERFCVKISLEDVLREYYREGGANVFSKGFFRRILAWERQMPLHCVQIIRSIKSRADLAILGGNDNVTTSSGKNLNNSNITDSPRSRTPRSRTPRDGYNTPNKVKNQVQDGDTNNETNTAQITTPRNLNQNDNQSEQQSNVNDTKVTDTKSSEEENDKMSDISDQNQINERDGDNINGSDSEGDTDNDEPRELWVTQWGNREDEEDDDEMDFNRYDYRFVFNTNKMKYLNQTRNDLKRIKWAKLNELGNKCVSEFMFLEAWRSHNDFITPNRIPGNPAFRNTSGTGNNKNTRAAKSKVKKSQSQKKRQQQQQQGATSSSTALVNLHSDDDMDDNDDDDKIEIAQSGQTRSENATIVNDVNDENYGMPKIESFFINTNSNFVNGTDSLSSTLPYADDESLEDVAYRHALDSSTMKNRTMTRSQLLLQAQQQISPIPGVLFSSTPYDATSPVYEFLMHLKPNKQRDEILGLKTIERALLDLGPAHTDARWFDVLLQKYPFKRGTWNKGEFYRLCLENNDLALAIVNHPEIDLSKVFSTNSILPPNPDYSIINCVDATGCTMFNWKPIASEHLGLAILKRYGKILSHKMLNAVAAPYSTTCLTRAIVAGYRQLARELLFLVDENPNSKTYKQPMISLAVINQTCTQGYAIYHRALGRKFQALQTFFENNGRWPTALDMALIMGFPEIVDLIEKRIEDWKKIESDNNDKNDNL